MVKKSALVSLLFIIIAIVFAIISYSSYWYYYKVGNDDTYTKVQLKYDKVKLTVSVNGNKRTSTSEWNDGDDDAEKYKVVKTYQASLAFISLGFIVLVVAGVLVLLQSFDLLKKIPCIGGILNILGKFILIAGTVFCFLAMFIFLNLPKAMEDDCKDGLVLIPSSGACDDYKFTDSSDNWKYGPDLGWVGTVIASGASLIACIVNIIGGIF